MKELVRVVAASFQNLFITKPTIAYELVMLARNTQHEFFDKGWEKECEELNFLEPGGTMHDSVRNILVSMAEGEELEMRLISPLQDTPALT